MSVQENEIEIKTNFYVDFVTALNVVVLGRAILNGI